MQAVRVQSLLDQAGIASAAPAEIRRAGRTCDEGAVDLRCRIVLVRSPAEVLGGLSVGVGGPAWRGFWRTFLTGSSPSPCGPATTLREKPSLPTPWPAIGGAWVPGSVRTGPWVTPVGEPRTRPWTRPGARTRRWGGILPPGPTPHTMSVGVPRCDTVFSTPTGDRRPGQRVTPPRTLPAFPDAVWERPKTPVRGGGGLRRRWVGPDGSIYEWDGQHGTVEMYDRKGRHRGEFDPDTGEATKPAKPGRKPVR